MTSSGASPRRERRDCAISARPAFRRAQPSSSAAFPSAGARIEGKAEKIAIPPAIASTNSAARPSRKADVGDRRAGTEADQPPADAEQQQSADQAAVDRPRCRQIERLAGQRLAAPKRNAEGEKGDHDRAAHNESERGVPGAGEIEEAKHLGWIGHAREAEAEAEQEADEERRSASHERPPQSTRRTMKTVANPAAMNVRVAASERGDNRASPQTPCPLV